jgi:hypothetical protein
VPLEIFVTMGLTGVQGPSLYSRQHEMELISTITLVELPALTVTPRWVINDLRTPNWKQSDRGALVVLTGKVSLFRFIVFFISNLTKTTRTRADLHLHQANARIGPF